MRSAHPLPAAAGRHSRCPAAPAVPRVLCSTNLPAPAAARSVYSDPARRAGSARDGGTAQPSPRPPCPRPGVLSPRSTSAPSGYAHAFSATSAPAAGSFPGPALPVLRPAAKTAFRMSASGETPACQNCSASAGSSTACCAARSASAVPGCWPAPSFCVARPCAPPRSPKTGPLRRTSPRTRSTAPGYTVCPYLTPFPAGCVILRAFCVLFFLLDNIAPKITGIQAPQGPAGPPFII